MTQSQLTVIEPQQIVNVTESALSIDQIVKQRQLITDCMARAMKEDQHYGKVPGCGDKPTLLQPGAQLLAHLFRLRPEYDLIETDLPNSHKRFRVTCRLFFIGSLPEIRIAEGVGESSSMESKHRFRNAAAAVEETGEALPRAYWGWRETEGGPAANKKLGEAFDGQSVGPKKINGQWMVVIFKGGGDDKVENPNPADVFNTVLKIAKKRAFVDAVITATASSDFFTQDLEDIRENLAAVETGHENGQTAKATAPATTSPKTAAAKQPKAKKAPTAASGDDDQIPMFNGEKHKLLAVHLASNSIETGVFMEAMRAANQLPPNKMTFDRLPEEMATRFVDDLAGTLEVCANFKKQKAG